MPAAQEKKDDSSYPPMEPIPSPVSPTSKHILNPLPSLPPWPPSSLGPASSSRLANWGQRAFLKCQSERSLLINMPHSFCPPRLRTKSSQGPQRTYSGLYQPHPTPPHSASMLATSAFPENQHTPASGSLYFLLLEHTSPRYLDAQFPHFLQVLY